MSKAGETQPAPSSAECDWEHAKFFSYGLEPGPVLGEQYWGALTVLSVPVEEIQLWDMDRDGTASRAEGRELGYETGLPAAYTWGEALRGTSLGAPGCNRTDTARE